MENSQQWTKTEHTVEVGGINAIDDIDSIRIAFGGVCACYSRCQGKADRKLLAQLSRQTDRRSSIIDSCSRCRNASNVQPIVDFTPDN